MLTNESGPLRRSHDITSWLRCKREGRAYGPAGQLPFALAAPNEHLSAQLPATVQAFAPSRQLTGKYAGAGMDVTPPVPAVGIDIVQLPRNPAV